ncbi:hypothetical protein Airi01_031080 [Actinoallomurus iriomotensis]|uniref:Uncharacterized protein n=1 Tax=Actinoallomurus iriomotensis TaxID=478107 RepID=A0A9W6VQP3_9ACTN|nr:hypothetical protein Airi01_031080 [Actinoallomurus iriomotensis]
MAIRAASQVMLAPSVQKAIAIAQAIWAMRSTSSSIEMILTYSTWVAASSRNFFSCWNCAAAWGTYRGWSTT